MLRLIFILVFLLCVFVGALGWALNHWFGWKGMLAFPFVLLLALWIGKKLVGILIKRFALGLFSMKSGVLKGATIQVHSITPVAIPPSTHDARADDEDAGDDEVGDEDADTDADSNEAEEAASEQERPREHFEVDLTVTPREGCGDRVWEPGEFVLTSEPVSSLEEIEEKEIGTTENVQIWKDSAFSPDEEGKYPGTQRLKLTIAVQPGASKAWLQYYNQSLGALTLPPWTPASESASGSALAPG